MPFEKADLSLLARAADSYPRLEALTFRPFIDKATDAALVPGNDSQVSVRLQNPRNLLKSERDSGAARTADQALNQEAKHLAHHYFVTPSQLWASDEDNIGSNASRPFRTDAFIDSEQQVTEQLSIPVLGELATSKLVQTRQWDRNRRQPWGRGGSLTPSLSYSPRIRTDSQAQWINVVTPSTPASLMPATNATFIDREDGRSLTTDLIRGLEFMRRGERITPPCDRCRRLHMDCLKDRTVCMGCTKKRAQCSWRDAPSDDLEQLSKSVNLLHIGIPLNEVPQRNPKREDWERVRTTIIDKYEVKNTSLQKIMVEMEHQYGFIATEAVYKAYLRKWGVSRGRKVATASTDNENRDDHMPEREIAIFVSYTISEDRCGSENDFVGSRLAALGERSRRTDWHSKREVQGDTAI